VLELEEKVILQKLKAGEQSAFDNIFRSYYKYLVSIAYKYTQNMEVSRDLAQEVYLDLWKRRESIDIDHSIKFFLRKATINKCLANKRKSSRMLVNSEITDNYDSVDDTTSNLIGFRELNNVIEGVVNELPDRCRQVFKASRYDNLSHKEIAESLDISVKTIENQMTKALKYLRTNLKKLGLISFLMVFFYL